MHSEKLFIIIRPCSLDNNNQKQTSTSETFNIRQKLGLFGLHSYANIDKVEVFHVLGPRHLRYDKVALLNIIGYSIFYPDRDRDNKIFKNK